MIRGLRCILRTVREADLAQLYTLVSDTSLQGDYMSLPLRSEPSFRKEFAETGFLGAKRGRFLVTDFDDRLLGTVVYFDVNYMDGFEIGYHLFDPDEGTTPLERVANSLARNETFTPNLVQALRETLKTMP